MLCFGYLTSGSNLLRVGLKSHLSKYCWGHGVGGHQWVETAKGLVCQQCHTKAAAYKSLSHLAVFVFLPRQDNPAEHHHLKRFVHLTHVLHQHSGVLCCVHCHGQFPWGRELNGPSVPRPGGPIGRSQACRQRRRGCSSKKSIYTSDNFSLKFSTSCTLFS